MTGWIQGLRKVRGALGSAHPMAGPIFRRQEQGFHFCRMLVPAFYGLMFFSAMQILPFWEGIMSRTQLQLLWPVMWLDGILMQEGILGILILYLVGSGLAMVLPQWFVIRLLAFLGVFSFWALNNSTGKIGHSLHLMILISFVLLWLPTGWHSPNASRMIRSSLLWVIGGAQAVMLLSYSMAGLVKLIAGLAQLVQGEPNVFFPDALARHVADRLLQTGSESWVGEILIDHLWISGPLMWFTLYIEFFAIWAVFRPRLQPWFAAALISFHIGSYFSMTIIFPQNCVLLGLFLAAQPTVGGWQKLDIRKLLEDLPGMGWCFRFRSKVWQRGSRPGIDRPQSGTPV